MHTTIGELTHFLETIAPLSLQESYDNSGLLTGRPQDPVRGVLIALDMTEAVVREAIALGCNVIVAHHPIIFRGLRRLTGDNYVERVVIEAIRHDIALYAIHTNLDNVLHQGVNGRIAEQLGLQEVQVLVAKEAGNSHTGLGATGILPAPMSTEEFLHYLKVRMACSVVRHSDWDHRPIQRVAVCGGAGSSFLAAAIAVGADAYVSADFKYHEFFDAEGRILIADIGHYESEQFTIPLLKALINNNFRNFASHSTTLNTNPVKYA